ncbi:hypothetical protein BAE44_0007376 [Dichanthelium oligosanthes]|uniref:Uncharacterized protein n=1 Tax=Dichanthelium oligosanthes TaxID=888268 RepID=A0A1E5W2G2_9POAL|nr:hypothetical protein BAE44_0007376 [Dichanthelium oligosanthes]
MDPSLSIEIIAFWLLVEANGEVDFLRHINSFHGDNFTALVAMGKQFIDAMHGNPVDLKSGSAREFHKQVFAGICFILSNVCYKVLNDLRQKAMAIHHRDVEESPDSNYLVLRQYVKDQPHISTSYHQYQGDSSTSTRSMPRAIKFIEDMVRTRDGIQSVNAFSPDLGNMIPQQHKNTGLNISSRSIIMSTAVQNHQDTVKMRYGAQSMNAFSTDLDFISPQQQKAFGVKISSKSDIHDLESLFSNCTISPKFPSEWDNRFHQSCPQQQKTFGGVNVSSESDIHDLELLFRNCTISPKFPSEWDNTFPQSRPQQKKTFGGVNMYSGSDIHDLESLFSKRTISSKFPSEWDNTFSQSSTMNMDPCVHSPIPHHSLVPEDDRTLFVTFSNGYPLTKEEVYNFFMR